MVRFYYIVGNFLKNKKLLTKLVETMAIAVGLFSTAFAFVFDYKCCRLYLHNFLSVLSYYTLRWAEKNKFNPIKTAPGAKVCT